MIGGFKMTRWGLIHHSELEIDIQFGLDHKMMTIPPRHQRHRFTPLEQPSENPNFTTTKFYKCKIWYFFRWWSMLSIILDRHITGYIKCNTKRLVVLENHERHTIACCVKLAKMEYVPKEDDKVGPTIIIFLWQIKSFFFVSSYSPSFFKAVKDISENTLFNTCGRCGNHAIPNQKKSLQ